MTKMLEEVTMINRVIKCNSPVHTHSAAL